MLTSFIKKKIFLAISCILIILVLYFFPKNKDNYHIIHERKNNKKDTIIYLKDQNDYVSRVSLYIDSKTTEEKIKNIINCLTVKSTCSNYLKNGFYPIIPEKTKILSVSIDNNLVKINFSKEFLNINETNEDKMISAIVYSITSLDKIDSISIYIEGDLLTKLPNSNQNINPVLDRSFGINKKYDITNFNGVSNTTIYYLSKQDNYYYYVPVTMIKNDNKNDKMEIIIKELASKASYQTGLISYLKNVKQMSYEVNNDILLVNINKDLYKNLSNSNLLETVIYSINLSIEDNYDITKVIYLVDNSYYKTFYI